ncbi:hypothetical protein RFI_02493 [Reticulomyxa filosa]|uniref:Uncharacterized protein n=1 Tax=Reticulomyxa filosa TaxID=46433 RepID=X6P907_RETFI|nr:hypothetical protein RFI_02493 [Reticulomyxa filosa]|eukprot:ETO34598.1 hypothetical protein RFI_02493 [Reticulomyxa filosa]
MSEKKCLTYLPIILSKSFIHPNFTFERRTQFFSIAAVSCSGCLFICCFISPTTTKNELILDYQNVNFEFCASFFVISAEITVIQKRYNRKLTHNSQALKDAKSVKNSSKEYLKFLVPLQMSQLSQYSLADTSSLPLEKWFRNSLLDEPEDSESEDQKELDDLTNLLCESLSHKIDVLPLPEACNPSCVPDEEDDESASLATDLNSPTRICNHFGETEWVKLSRALEFWAVWS